VAKKKRRKRSWLRALFLFVLTPLIIWLLAFFLWFYWHDLSKPFREDPRRNQTAPKAEQPAKNRSKETILEEDRRKLDEILKKQGG
jgi:hypothetical protein